jgi:hypothetical protein
MITILKRLNPMTVGAPHVALRYLSHHPLQRDMPTSHFRQLPILARWIAVVEIKSPGIGEPAVYARVRRLVGHDKIPIALCSPTVRRPNLFPATPR